MNFPNPTLNRYKPLEGKGVIQAKIYFKSMLLGSDEAYLIRELFYEYTETVNGLEVFLENPDIQNATALQEDIRIAMIAELKEQGIQYETLIINFYENSNQWINQIFLWDK